jgi:hypothetical protein
MSSVKAIQNKENVGEDKFSQKLVATKQNVKSSNSSGTRKPLNVFNKKDGFSNISKDRQKGVPIFKDSEKETSGKLPKEEPKKSPTKNEATTQTQLTGSDLIDYQQMVSPDTQYYKDLAEARREALDESLKENEELFIEKEEYKEKNQYLEEKVLSLEETVEKARKITEMIEPYLNDNEEDKDEDEIKQAVIVETDATSSTIVCPEKDESSDCGKNAEGDNKEIFDEKTVPQTEDN